MIVTNFDVTVVRLNLTLTMRVYRHVMTEKKGEAHY